MRKWQTLAAPDDPNVWAMVENMWPTGQGSYETSDYYASSSTAVTATGETGQAKGVWVFNALSGQRAYYIGKYIWELGASFASTTDRTGALGADAVAAATGGHACQYGNVTLICRGTAASLISSTGGNFAALAGSPSARYVATCARAVVAANTATSADEVKFSDVGDYTNWTTGEAETRRVIDNNGPITGLCPHGDAVYIFKTDSIFRATYIGGVLKWAVEKVWEGLGMASTLVGGGSPCVSTPAGVFFYGGIGLDGAGIDSTETARHAWYLFDGASQPVLVSGDIVIPSEGIPVFDPKTNIVTVYCLHYDGASYNNKTYFYSLNDHAWGRGATIVGAAAAAYLHPLRGEANAVAGFSYYSPARPIFGGAAAANSIYYRTPQTARSTSMVSYVQTQKMGAVGQVTAFSRATPRLRRRVEGTAPDPVCALAMNYYTELHDTTAASTGTAIESTTRDRFDFQKSVNFGQFKVTFTAIDAEIDDVLVTSKPAGAN